ncbi:hypothetical protein [Chondromyces apiculatus]|uniref:PH domain-containing protein n=1 Tax=Chondromyces apiculatus DSM 436 TaxID=1192034 RepID=A0A017SVG5_9BACT|nr:hypothetical protein [Chondromyces apiculatus]EYF00301.1 Hypothetical protein CAP_0953 [Chondromyces apiculatus DSM 436]
MRHRCFAATVETIVQLVAKSRIVLRDRALRVHAYGDARFFARGAAWCILASALMVVLGLAAPELLVPPPLSLLVVTVTLATGFLLAAAVVWLGAAWGSATRHGALRVSDALYLEGRGRRLQIPLAAVQRAHLRRRANAITLGTDRGVVLTVALRAPGEASRLLDALAQPGATAPFRVCAYLPSPRHAREVITVAIGFALCLIGMFVTRHVPVALVLGTLAGLSTWFLARMAGWPAFSADLVVGRDGIALRHQGKERFLPLSRIARADPLEGGISLTLTDGEHLRIFLSPPALRRPAGSLTADLCTRRCAHLLRALHDHLHAQPEAAALTPSPAADVLLARRGRALSDWRAALRAAVTDDGGTYRTATLSPARALEVLEDGRAPLDHRIGAALALAPTRDRRAARRLRIAIATSASEDVRAALEQAAEDELQESTLARAHTATGEP